MESFKTEQEYFWVGSFGDDYIDRNSVDLLPRKVSFWSEILRRTSGVQSILELGANIGLNLSAIRTLIPAVRCTAVEINEKAVSELRKNGFEEVVHDSILNYSPNSEWDFVFTCGVLIHIDPEHLPQVYDLLYHASNNYILVAEYYNPTPVEILYRGNERRAFKRDFAGEMLDRFSDLHVLDYGFRWHRDTFPSDDITWFLLQKTR